MLFLKRSRKAYEKCEINQLFLQCNDNFYTTSSTKFNIMVGGSFPYRMVMVLMNIVVGASMEYLVNRYSVTRRKNLFKGLVALVLLVTNIVWIVATII